MRLPLPRLLGALGVLVVAGGLGLLVSPDSVRAADLGWGYSTPQVIRGPSAYNSWPVLSGDALAFASGPRHAPPTERVVVLRTPAGRSVLSRPGEDLSIFALGRTPSGRLVGILRVVTPSSWSFRTLDGADLRWPYRPILVSPILTLASGEMIAQWHSGPESGERVAWGLLRSRDGRTWSQEVKGTAASVSSIPVEGRMVELRGRVLLLARQEATAGGLWQATSIDGGRSFTVPTPTNITDGLRTPPAVVADRYGLAVYYYDRRDRVLRVRRSRTLPVAQGWPPSSVVHRGTRDGRAVDSGYVHATTVPGGHLLAWYEGDRKATAIHTMVAKHCTRPSVCRSLTRR